MKPKKQFDAKIRELERSVEAAPKKSLALKRLLNVELKAWKEARGML